jgi:sirohydrochlorin ferrochelatase
VAATLLLAAHGTRSPDGSATTRALVDAVARRRPAVPVRLCFLDVAAPALGTALAELAGTDVVVVPLLLSAGYHVQTDIPTVVAGRTGVRVSAHLGPHPAIIAALVDRLRVVDISNAATVALAGIGSSRSSARCEVDDAAGALAAHLGRAVTVLPLGPGFRDRLDALPAPVAVATYLLAPGGFFDSLRSAVAGRGMLSEPIGAHPAVVELVWQRYDAALRADEPSDPVR